MPKSLSVSPFTPKECKWSNLNAPGTQSTQVWRIPLSHLQPSPLRGNKNWPSSMKVKKLKSFCNKIGSKGCKWPNLNAPGTQSTQVWRIPLSHLQPSPLRGNKNWPSSMKVKKLKSFCNKIGSKGCKWSNLNALGTQSTQVGRIPPSHFQPSPLWGNKK